MPSVWLSISWWTHRLSWLDPIFSWLDPWLDPNFSWLDPKSPWSKKHLFAVQLTTFRSRTRGSSQPSAAPGAVLRYLPHRHPAVAGEVRVGGTAEFQGTTAPAFPGEKNWGRLGYSNPPKKRCRIQIRNRNIVRIYSSCRIFLEVAILVYLLWIIGLGHFIAMIFRDRNIYIYIPFWWDTILLSSQTCNASRTKVFSMVSMWFWDDFGVLCRENHAIIYIYIAI